MSAGCTFCRILRGELPKVLVEDGRHAVAFLDRNQAARGHLLIVARAHVASWHELDEATISEMALRHRDFKSGNFCATADGRFWKSPLRAMKIASAAHP